MTANQKVRMMNIATAVGMGLTAACIIWGFQQGIFTSREALERFLNSCGIWAPVLFVVFQAVQVVVPVLPGGIGCLVGVLVFGPVWGFVYNYIGICIGSAGAFYLARRYGQSFVRMITKPATYEKYCGWLEKGNRFDKWFAAAIFLPVAPDDFLCFLAGLTRMSAKKFTGIILLGKPFGILAYSIGLQFVYTQVIALLG